MKLEDIKKIIKDGGATLTGDLKKADIKRGYMVSLEGAETQLKLNNYGAINKAIEEKRELIKNNKDLYVGLWVDNEVLYIDVSINILNKVDALEFGKKNKQIAVYDVVNNDSIYLKDYDFIKYYTLYEVVRDKQGNIKDYKLKEQRDNINTFKSVVASAKTLLNATYNSIDKISNNSRFIDGKYIIIKDYELSI